MVEWLILGILSHWAKWCCRYQPSWLTILRRSDSQFPLSLAHLL